MLRMTASDPLYAEWNELLTRWAQICNPTCFFDMLSMDVNSAEYRAECAVWRGEIVERFEELAR